MAEFTRRDGVSLKMGRPPEMPMGVLNGCLDDVQTDHDPMTDTTRITIRMRFTNDDLADNGGLGWLRPGERIQIRQ